MSFSHKTRVGVLRGGPSPEYDVSMNTGKTILANLPDEYEPLDIFISKEGVWHIRGLEKEPYKIIQMIDVAVNATHGTYGEDGNIQKLFEHFHIPYSGSDSLASALGMNKDMSKDIFKRQGLKTPHHILINRDEVLNKTINKINESFLFPIIIKPVNSGSSLGINFVNRSDKVRDALLNSFEHSPNLIVEEYITGKEATCGIIEGFRGAPFYSLLPVEIVGPEDKYFHNYNSKYVDLKSKYRVPGNFTEEENNQIQKTAILVHQILGLRHYSRSDFILHPKRGLFVLEANTLPELSHRSSFIKSLEAVGGNIKEFLSHLLSKTLGK